LALNIIEGQLTRDTEFFGKMDPFIVVETNGHKYRTPVVSEGGKNPVWNKVFFIPVSSMGDELTLTCYDEDKLSNDVVGEVQIPMYSLCRNGGVRDWFDIIYKKKTSGKILI
jgi:Ca2+-dependent lipid-binding protein